MRFLSKKAVGLDIADHTIEAAELKKSGSKIEVVSLGRARLGRGIVEGGRIKDEKKLEAALKSVFSRAKPYPIEPENVIFGLPESQVYIHAASLDRAEGAKRSPRELDAFARRSAESSIPLAGSDLIYSYRILEEGDAKKEVLIAATSKEVMAEWSGFFEKAKVGVDRFDVEALAVRRALAPDFVSKNRSMVLLDMGAKTSSVAIFDGMGHLRHSYAIPVGGEAMTAKLASALKVDLEAAEKMKKQAGISGANKKVNAVLAKILGVITVEVKRALLYFHKTTGEEAKQIVLVGGSSRLKGLADYLASNLDLPVKLGKAGYHPVPGFAGYRMVPGRAQNAESQLLYIEAIGLALAGLEERWKDKDPSFEISNTEVAEGRGADRRKVRVQVLLLAGILLFGLIAVLGAFWYRSVERSKRAAELEAQRQTAPQEEEGDAEELVPPPAVEETEVEEEEAVREVTILQTPTGWLNVRTGPGTNYSKIGLVYPGESYPQLDESAGWYKIELSSGQEGWIYSLYAKKE